GALALNVFGFKRSGAPAAGAAFFAAGAALLDDGGALDLVCPRAIPHASITAIEKVFINFPYIIITDGALNPHISTNLFWTSPVTRAAPSPTKTSSSRRMPNSGR